MSTVLAARILQHYGLQPMHVHDVQKGYRNESYATQLADGRMANVILYKREQGIVARVRRANRVADFAAEAGLPARRTLDPRIVQLGNGSVARHAAVYEYLPGATIPWEGYTMTHLKELGGMMSTLHAVLAPLPRGQLHSVIEEGQTLLDRMCDYFAQAGVQQALANKLRLQIPTLDFDLAAYRQLPAQALHMDFVRGNILFNGTRQITGILDFEKTAWGPPMFDIARTLAFLLVDCKYKPEAKVRKYFLHSGYNKRGPLTFVPTEALEQLVNLFLVHDLYKFLRHNPYESLEQNEHFVRTRDFLVHRRQLKMLK